MIQIKNLNTGFIHIVRPTMFPDGTSQVWKLPLNNIGGFCRVMWNFESEAELIHLIQLITLLHVSGIHIDELYVPYLPYGRQDKHASNEATFALLPFLHMLPELTAFCMTLDAHSNVSSGVFSSYSPLKYIKRAIKGSRADVLVFPDSGAKTRSLTSDLPVRDFVVLDKNRDQSTGQILSQIIDKSASNYSALAGRRLLIVDDICDGGWTFTSAAKLLRETEPSIASIDLYVTHGIFSKGFECLHQAGIREIYTTKSLIKNNFGFDLEEF